MEFLCVGQTKLKVILSESECESLGVGAVDGAHGGREARAAVRRILELAEEKCGFRVSGERVLVQRYPLVRGGAELFITRLSSVSERERKAIIESPELLTFGKQHTFYRFSCFDELVRAARAVSGADCRCNVYCSDTGEYYISVRESSVGGISECEVLSEFGTRIHALPTGLSGERGRLLIKDKGIEILSRI